MRVWLNGEIMEEAEARVSPFDRGFLYGEPFTAWGGYISGTNLELEPGRRILQSWRTTRFTESDEDSTIEVMLEPVVGGTRVAIHHANVPDGHTGYQNGGWENHYFLPMKNYFSGG